MGAQALGSSHACYQHPPSRIRNAGTTTTSVDSYTGDKIKVPGDPGHHWGGHMAREKGMRTHMAREKDTLSATRSILDEWIANFRLAWQQSKE